MPWQDEMVPTLRVLLLDLDETNYTFSDERLEQILVVAAMQVAREASFSQDFVSSPANVTITPDPTAAATADPAFVNLTCIKATCIVDRGEARAMVKQGLYVKDGSSAVDLRSLPLSKLKLIESDRGWCAVYENEKYTHALNQAGEVAGAVVLTPFRMFPYGQGL